MKKKLLFALLCAATLPAAPALANDSIELSGNVGFVSQYSFRGIAQSDESVALQGGFDVAHTSGIYAGMWGSNIDFNSTDNADLEVDLYGGYSGDFKGISYDIGAIYYAYPGADSGTNYNFWEAAVALGYDFGAFSASASINHSPNFFGDSGDAQYYALGVDVPLPKDITFSAHVGHQDIDNNTRFGVDDYTDWSLGFGYTFKNFDLSATYVDTNLGDNASVAGDCADGCDSRVIFGISRSF